VAHEESTQTAKKNTAQLFIFIPTLVNNFSGHAKKNKKQRTVVALTLTLTGVQEVRAQHAQAHLCVYVYWAKWYIRFHGLRHPTDMGSNEIRSFELTPFYEGEVKYVKTTIGLGLIAGRVIPELVSQKEAQQELSDMSFTGTLPGKK
jgi:hypothetical protein